MPDGPIEDNDWPRQLPSRVSAPQSGRLHGFDVVSDLARHYSFAEIGFIALRGEAPSEQEGRLFELALSLLSATPVSEPPAHVASLSRTCGTAPTSAIATGVVVLAEQVRWQIEQWAPLLAWVQDPQGDPPAAAIESSGDVQRMLVATLPPDAGSLARCHPFTTEAAGLALLHELGMAEETRLAATLIFARTPRICAEVVAARPGALREYPIATPDFAYDPPTRS